MAAACDPVNLCCRLCILLTSENVFELVWVAEDLILVPTLQAQVDRYSLGSQSVLTVFSLGPLLDTSVFCLVLFASCRCQINKNTNTIELSLRSTFVGTVQQSDSVVTYTRVFVKLNK
jgi:hypothetical protein